MNELKKPDFVILGAMKSATSTLYEQLMCQSGIFMPALKEPNFFSDDDQYAKGIDWYVSLFFDAMPGDLMGEASTHYTKLPDYPNTINRMTKFLDEPKLIYIMRHPIKRLESHFIHEWTMGNVSESLDQSITLHKELINYSLYNYQINPYLERYGTGAILPVFFERLVGNPQVEFERICKFIGYSKIPVWQKELPPKNASNERIRRFPFYELVVEHPVSERIRQKHIPKGFRAWIKRHLQMRERPTISEESEKLLEAKFDSDLKCLGVLLGVNLNCRNYYSIVTENELDWV